MQHNLQQQYVDSDSGANAYLLVTPSGGRVEMRQVGWANIYESVDGTYTQLTFEGATPVVRTTDGTQLRFVWNTSQNEYRCVEIKDRNGNFITINYGPINGRTDLGRPTSVMDTLGRTVNFNYDANHYLRSITQTWRRDTQSGLGAAETHAWATFDYGTVVIQRNFADQAGPLDVYGPAYGASIPVLTKVGLPDGTYYEFDYTSWGQINRINRRSPAGWLLSRTAYGLSSDTSSVQSDCPRVTERREWASWANGDTGDHTVGPGPEEAVTTYAAAADSSWSQVTPPDPTPGDASDNVVFKEYFHATGWQKGLTSRTEVLVGGALKKWTTTSWTQDDVNAAHQINPRPDETVVEDADGNRRRTVVAYATVSGISLPSSVEEHAKMNGVMTLVRRTVTDYRWDAEYLNRRVVGLVGLRRVYDGAGALVSKLEYHYDWRVGHMEASAPSVQHDGTNYGANLDHGRGVVTGVRRYNVNAPDDPGQGAWVQSSGYNLAGLTVWVGDASGHVTRISYADNYSDGNNARNTLAHPTSVTDADNFQSTAQYNYSMGVLFRSVDPKGAEQRIFYDTAGRPERSLNVNNSAYTDYAYNPDWGHFITNTTVEAGRGLAYTNTIVDGRGQVRLFVASHPNSTGGYLAVRYGYDALGRKTEQTNPTEIYGWGDPAGDDAATGFQRTLQSYDWQGRPTLTTYPTGNTVEVSYGGCGCAGGEVSTVRDERARRKKYKKDGLGRLSKVEELNWDESLYSTTTYSYNARDQITEINQAGLVRTLTYDGHGRLWKRTTPEQGTTEYAYNPDDTVEWVKDARGAQTSLVYNARHLVSNVNYAVPAGVAHTPNVRMEYDAAGNRTLMEDGLGSATYAYDALSRLDWEERRFNGVPGPNNGAFGIDYDYNLAGQLTRINNPWGAHVTYEHDANGRTTAVRGMNTLGQPSYAGVDYYAQNMAYRASGALKAASYKNGRTLSTQYDARQRLSQWNVAGVFGYNYSYDKFGEKSFRVTYAQHLADPTLNRSFDYDHVGRLWEAHSGSEADAHVNGQPFPAATGPFSHSYRYDVWGNETYRVGWGGFFGSGTNQYQVFTNNRNDGFVYDAAGNLTYDGAHYTYDAAGQQASGVYPAGWGGYANYTLYQSYDGDGLRAKKVDNGETVYYLRSAALGGQVVAEVRYNINYGGWYWSRGYVYAGRQLLAIQDGAVRWVHQDPVAKGQRFTDINGTETGALVLDPWGGETSRSWGQSQQPQRFTSYERDGSGNDQAMLRQYHGYWHRFDQPDPYDGSYDLSDPQSLNRYSYTQNDPVNFTDPTGLDPNRLCLNGECWGDGMGTIMVGAALGWLAGGGGGGWERGIPLDLDAIRGPGGGGGTQGNQPGQTNCETLANAVAAFAAASLHNGSFSTRLSNRFRVPDDEAHQGRGRYLEFRSTGFKRDFRDDTPSAPGQPPNTPNQVHHYVGVMTAAFSNALLAFAGATAATHMFGGIGGQLSYSWVLNKTLEKANAREPGNTPSDVADRALNSIAVRHGVDLAYNRISRHALADMIRREVCE